MGNNGKISLLNLYNRNIFPLRVLRKSPFFCAAPPNRLAPKAQGGFFRERNPCISEKYRGSAGRRRRGDLVLFRICISNKKSSPIAEKLSGSRAIFRGCNGMLRLNA